MQFNNFEFNNKYEFNNLIKKLPRGFSDYFLINSKNEKITEILLDLGRQPQIRFFNDQVKYVSRKQTSWQDIDFIVKRINTFSKDNRSGFDHTLHRICCIRNRHFLITGLTCRIGRLTFGINCLIRDLLKSEKSILILGKPGTGKTTVIREFSRVLSNDMLKRVMVIDTSNEISGTGDSPHIAIGKARLLTVPKTKLQHEIMLEAVENHMPQIIIIDEISTKLESLAVKIIAEKGVKLIGTVHGSCLENIINNPDLSQLIGDVGYVTLSDELARQRKIQKSLLERKGNSSFNILVELYKKNEWIIHENLNQSIDRSINNIFNYKQFRKYISNEQIEVSYKLERSNYNSNLFLLGTPRYQYWKFNKFRTLSKKKNRHKLTIFLYSFSSNIIREIIIKNNLNLKISDSLQDATLIIGLQNNIKHNSRLLKMAKYLQIPIFVFPYFNFYDIINFVKFILK